MDTIIAFAINITKKKQRTNQKNCPICQIPIIFCDFEKDLPNNMFNEKFLWEYHNKLNFHLQEILMVDKSAYAAFQTMSFSTAEGTGTLERHGMSLLGTKLNISKT